MIIGKDIKWIYEKWDNSIPSLPIVRTNIQAHIVQLFNKIDTSGKEKPISCATASMVIIDGIFYLLTAAHVADEPDLSVPCPGSLSKTDPYYMSLEHFRYKSIPPAGKRCDDRKDWALIPIAAEIILGFMQLGIEPSPFAKCSSAKIYTIAGYPSSKCKVVSYAGKKEIKSRPYAYISHEISDADYKKYGLNKKINIALYFNRENSFCLGDPNHPITFPNTAAMSGSPIYNELGYIVGVFTECSKDKKIMVGVRACAIFEDVSIGNYEVVDIDRDLLIKPPKKTV